MIVTVIGQKGGGGKSTIAVHLAGWRVNRGSDTLLIDSDRQGTARFWSLSRADLGLPTPETIQQFDRSIGRSALNFAKRFDDIIIDVARRRRNGDGHKFADRRSGHRAVSAQRA